MKPHRGGLIMGLGIGSLGAWLVGFVGGMVLAPCGCSGLVGLGLAIFAWVMANQDMREMAAGTMDPSGLGNTKAGKICGIITVGLVILSIILTIVLVMVLGVAFAAAGAGGAFNSP